MSSLDIIFRSVVDSVCMSSGQDSKSLIENKFKTRGLKTERARATIAYLCHFLLKNNFTIQFLQEAFDKKSSGAISHSVKTACQNIFYDRFYRNSILVTILVLRELFPDFNNSCSSRVYKKKPEPFTTEDVEIVISLLYDKKRVMILRNDFEIVEMKFSQFTNSYTGKGVDMCKSKLALSQVIRNGKKKKNQE